MSVETEGDCSLLMAGPNEGLGNTTQTLQEATSEIQFCGCLAVVEKQKFFCGEGSHCTCCLLRSTVPVGA